MAKRLYMTSADYLAIAISPALIMALVGSLVFFLIEVVYVGQYQARLNYAFALFVFAAVLIARISIEMGSERAALFALPLGGVMFAFLVRFVEFDSAYSHVINFALLGIVWWCAHKLTWDSTVINDREDASGEGLMQRIGVDGPERDASHDPHGTKENELLGSENTDVRPRWWQRLFTSRSGPHMPGLWVLYFSVAALPLFGIGQHFIPAGEVGRRGYVFVLLLIYVAAALSLLVTTSFLNLRRYLRQRHIEMPLPIAGTWVGVGVVLIVIVMMFAALIPRPNAEIALSRVPWQIGSPGDLEASRTSVLKDGGEEQGEQQSAQTGKAMSKEGQPGQMQPGEERSGGSQQSGEQNGSSTSQGDESSDQSEPSQSADGKTSSGNSDPSSQQQSGDETNPDNNPSGNQNETGKPSDNRGGSEPSSQSNSPSESAVKPPQENPDESESSAVSQPAGTTTPPPTPFETVLPQLGGLYGALKILFYILAALALLYGVWRYRHQILQTIADILRQLRELFTGSPRTGPNGEEEAPTRKYRSPGFTTFRDPFATGQHSRMSPEELVRYTFAAFEAWANDRGTPRSPDCTPQELINLSLEPQTPIYAEAHRLIRLYGQVAYAAQPISRESASELSQMWQLLRSEYTSARPALAENASATVNAN